MTGKVLLYREDGKVKSLKSGYRPLIVSRERVYLKGGEGEED